MAFGGRDLSTLYITTAREALTTAQVATQPHAGDIFACTPGAGGPPAEPLRGLTALAPLTSPAHLSGTVFCWARCFVGHSVLLGTVVDCGGLRS